MTELPAFEGSLDDALLVIPYNIADKTVVMVVLQEHNIERIREHDPVVIEVGKLLAAIPEGDVKLTDFVVTFGSPEDIAFVERCLAEDQPRAGLRHLVRGFRYRPGDDSPITRLGPNPT